MGALESESLVETDRAGEKRRGTQQQPGATVSKREALDLPQQQFANPSSSG